MAGESSVGGIDPKVKVGPKDPSIDGYQRVTYGNSPKYGKYELLGGAIQGEIYHFYREHKGDPYSDKMAISWSVTNAVYRVVYVYVRGSDCGNLYEYGDIQGDSGLHAPLKNGNVPDIHHITFYYIGETESGDEDDGNGDNGGTNGNGQDEGSNGNGQDEGTNGNGQDEGTNGNGQHEEDTEEDFVEDTEEQIIAEPEIPLSEPSVDEVITEEQVVEEDITRDSDELIGEAEIPLSEPSVDEVIPEEKTVAEAEIPLTILPTTGGAPAEILYGLGVLVSVIGAFIRKRSKE